MKPVGIISTTTLFLLLASAGSVFAQGDRHEEGTNSDKQGQGAPAQHEEKAKPERQEQQAKPVKEERQAKPVKEEQQAKPVKEEQQAKPVKEERQAKPVKEERQTKPTQQQQQQLHQPAVQNDHQQPVKQNQHAQQQNGQPHVQRTAVEVQRQRSAPALRLSVRGNGRIPDDRFHSNFGRDHRFRIGNPTLVGGYSRFQYGGYWFGFVQPWPVGWYYTDDVYVDYVDGGYYLCNPSYPGARISISVVI